MTAEFRWMCAAPRRTRARVAAAVLVVVPVLLGVGLISTGLVLSGAGFVVWAFLALPVVFTPRPRIEPDDHGVVVKPKPAVVNGTFVAPAVLTVSAVLLNAEWALTSASGRFGWLPFLAGLMVLVALATCVEAFRYGGRLEIVNSAVSVPRRFTVPLDGVVISVEMANRWSFPHISLRSATSDSKQRLIFPTKQFGLEANSLYSTLRHLAETDEATRKTYSPELIREMLLFTPDREVAVGDSIEVRVVAQPEVRTA